MPLITLQNISLSFGSPPLLDGIDLTMERGERICLIGRNGEGKSTLMKLIAGELMPDEGRINKGGETGVARLTQEIPGNGSGTVFEVVADGLGKSAELLKRYHAACLKLAGGSDETTLKRLSAIQHEMESAGGWQLDRQVEQVISRMGLEPDALFDSLSGGMKRRALLARALVSEPDVLLLDEPTNHLDIEAIAWLEEFLLDWKGCLLFVTHDRAFLRRLATRILELDRGHIMDWPGDYGNYLRRKEQMENAEEKAISRFDKKLAEEESWIRQGIKARRTRNEGRVRQLQAMREEARQRRRKQGVAKMQLDSGERSGRLVCEAEGVSYSWNGKPVVRGFNATILRGDRIGIIGPNGCGKSTLLNLLLGRLVPDEGTIRLGTRVEVAYFDQMRAQLDEEATVVDNVGGGRDSVIVNGRRKHVIGYLQEFLFPPQRARQPVKSLSGGERNRLLLAKLFTRPANLLVLDEPTNDLDVETLELLEELLLDFDGTLLLVSHDRVFLDNVVTSTLVFEGEGRVNGYVGGYSDWLAQRSARVAPESSAPVKRKERQSEPKRRAAPVRLSYREQKELDGLPAEIEALEVERRTVEQALANPDLYRTDSEAVKRLTARLRGLESELEARYERWEALEKKALA